MSRTAGAVSHAKEIFYLLCIAVFVVSALFTIWGPGGVSEMRRVKADLEAHRAKVLELQRTNSERVRSIEALKTDKEALEEYARKQGYGRKDEIIQQLPEEPAPPKPALPPPPSK